MEIKIFAFLSLIPALYVFNKVIKRKDITFFDVLLIFYTVYFALIPLLLDTKNIAYDIVKKDFNTHLYTFFFYNLFASLVILADKYILSLHKYPFFNLTGFLRKVYMTISFDRRIIILAAIIECYLWIMLAIDNSNAFEYGLGSMEQIRIAAEAKRSPITLLLSGGIHSLRLFCAYLLLGYYFFRKSPRYNKVFYLLCISLLCIYLQISRTYLLELMTFIMLLYYAVKRIITKKMMLITCIGAFILYVFIFPAMTAYRGAKRILMGSNDNPITLVETIEGAVDELYKGSIKVKDRDNKDARAWNVYQIYAYSFSHPVSYNGELTTAAFSIGIPKILYPNKSKYGSQGIIENALKIHEDVADSILLLANMENTILSPLIAISIFVFLFLCWNGFMTIFYKHTRMTICLPFFSVCFFMRCNRIEGSLDGFISEFIQSLIWATITYFVIRYINKLFHEKNTSHHSVRRTLR